MIYLLNICIKKTYLDFIGKDIADPGEHYII